MGRNIENGETKPEGVLVKAHCRRGRERRRPLKNYSSGGLESDLIVQSFGDQVRRTLYFIVIDFWRENSNILSDISWSMTIDLIFKEN